ncbi:hypothetical protein [Candidatus Nanohalobium constans]|uniref:Glycogenin-like protein n=1 Tax=Candidatus Nanohalobium constans TaxID=2565781 RepID=A0A5Q0UJC9_9ARCH|nr:hypothetical protein [Candidatus Nanohalobium constans]QGA81065.1 glycogenin-like protein [Candidatus Nanohalobium constans]
MEIKQNTVFVYTLSSRKNMVQQCLRSIATLKQHVEPEKIKIFYTPPYDKEDEEALKDTGAEIIKKENQTEAFNVSRSLPESHYGEKINLCSLESENVVFLDCDTVIGNDIWEVIEGDFEFKARPGSADLENWEDLFEEHGEEYMDWMPNAGFLIFKNGLHQEIQDKWVRYVNSDLESQGKVNHHEQYALALAVSGHHTQPMTKKEHVFEWNNEKIPDANIYHIEQAAGSSIVNVAKNYLKKLKP